MCVEETFPPRSTRDGRQTGQPAGPPSRPGERVNSGNTPNLESRSAWLVGRSRAVRDDAAQTASPLRGRRSRSLTGRRMPNASLSRASANYGCKAPTANAFLTRKGAFAGKDRRPARMGGDGEKSRQRNRNGPRRSRCRHARSTSGIEAAAPVVGRSPAARAARGGTEGRRGHQKRKARAKPEPLEKPRSSWPQRVSAVRG